MLEPRLEETLRFRLRAIPARPENAAERRGHAERRREPGTFLDCVGAGSVPELPAHPRVLARGSDKPARDLLSVRIQRAAAARGCSGFFCFGRASSMALRCSACSSSQMVIGLAMYQVEYVPEMMPTSMAAAKSQMVPTP